MAKALIVRAVQGSLKTDEWKEFEGGTNPTVTLSSPAIEASLSCYWNGQRFKDFRLERRQLLHLYGIFQPKGLLQVTYFRAF
jgi:hypothetical protein